MLVDALDALCIDFTATLKKRGNVARIPDASITEAKLNATLISR